MEIIRIVVVTQYTDILLFVTVKYIRVKRCNSNFLPAAMEIEFNSNIEVEHVYAYNKLCTSC